MQSLQTNEPFPEARQPISVEVADFARQLGKRALILSERVNAKLHSVMTSAPPRTAEGINKDPKEYPPLFSDLRNSFQAISSALETIDYALSRTELQHTPPSELNAGQALRSTTAKALGER